MSLIHKRKIPWRLGTTTRCIKLGSVRYSGPIPGVVTYWGGGRRQGGKDGRERERERERDTERERQREGSTYH